jgi:hypothetical protein
MYVAAAADGSATDSDNTYIYAYATNSSTTTPDNKRTDLLWTYPKTVSAAYSNLGSITGSGAYHRNGSVMFGTVSLSFFIVKKIKSLVSTPISIFIFSMNNDFYNYFNTDTSPYNRLIKGMPVTVVMTV